MAFAASLYAVPDLPAPRRKPAAAELKKSAAAAAEKEARQKRKIDQADRLIRKLDELDAKYAAEQRELNRRRARIVVRKEKITDRALTEMGDARLDKVAGVHVTFSTRLAPASLIVDDETLIPTDYLREKLVTSVDKIAIKQAMDRGTDVPGCHLEQKVSLVRK